MHTKLEITKQSSLAQTNEQLNNSYNNDKISFLEDKLEQLKQASTSNQLRTTWNLVEEISGKCRYNSATKIRKNNGTKINSITELTDEWKHYLEDLLNTSSTHLQQLKQSYQLLKIYQSTKILLPSVKYWKSLNN